MKKHIWFFVLMVAIFIGACTKVPITGRKQVKLLPNSTLNQMSQSEYQKFLATNAVVTSSADGQMVERVGVRIQKAVEKYFAAKKKSKYLEGYTWKFNLVDDPSVNAWCMPGGRVVVYTGLLKVTQSEDALAVVMGHEIAHALANHGNERMSQGLVAQLGGMALSTAISSKPEATQNIFLQAYGVGAQVGALLPFSRLQESEADELGLIFMAMAGYDPEASVPFWKRMAAAGGERPPKLLSTHPSPDSRIQNLKTLIPKAKLYAKRYR